MKTAILNNAESHVLRALIDAGTDVDEACWIATHFGRIDALRVLIEAGADVNLVDRDNRTLCSNAARRGHTEALRLLIDAGADVNKARHRCSAQCFIASFL